MITIICFITTFIFQTVFSVIDLRYKEFNSKKIILISYVPATIGGLSIYGFNSSFIFYFLWLAVLFYLIEVISEVTKGVNVIGGIDIIAAPIYTIWIGGGFLIFLIVFLLVFTVFGSKYVMRIASRVYINRDSNPNTLKQVPLLPVLQITCATVLVLQFFIFTL